MSGCETWCLYLYVTWNYAIILGSDIFLSMLIFDFMIKSMIFIESNGMNLFLEWYINVSVELTQTWIIQIFVVDQLLRNGRLSINLYNLKASLSN